MSTGFERRVARLRDHVLGSDAPIDDFKEDIEHNLAITFDDITKPEIIELLIEKGIKHNPKDKKEILFDLLIEGE